MIRILTLAACAALALTAAPAAVDRGALRVGAAQVDVTPPANPDYPASGKYAHERLYIRAIVLDNSVTRAALIGADEAGLAEGVWTAASKQIAQELGCPPENIIMSATHSHSATRSGPPGPGQAIPPEQATGRTMDAIMDAVRQAKAKLQPEQVGFGTGFSYLNVARDAISEDTHLWTQAPNPRWRRTGR